MYLNLGEAALRSEKKGFAGAGNALTRTPCGFMPGVNTPPMIDSAQSPTSCARN